MARTKAVAVRLHLNRSPDSWSGWLCLCTSGRPPAILLKTALVACGQQLTGRVAEIPACCARLSLRCQRFVDSPGDKVGPSSACSVLSPSLLTCLQDFIHVPRLKDENAAELFLVLRVGTVGGCHFAVPPVHGQRGFRRLERFSASPVPVGAKMVI